MKTKICSKCGIEKELSYFYNRRKEAEGRAKICILCVKKQRDKRDPSRAAKRKEEQRLASFKYWTNKFNDAVFLSGKITSLEKPINMHEFKKNYKRRQCQIRDSIVIDKMSDSYINALFGCKKDLLPHELVELKRVHLLIHRELKRQNENNKRIQR